MRMILFVAGAAALAAVSATPAEAQSRSGTGYAGTRAGACSSAKLVAEGAVTRRGYDVSSFSSCDCSAPTYDGGDWTCTADALYSSYRPRERSDTPSRPAPRTYVPSRPLAPLPPMPDIYRRGNY